MRMWIPVILLTASTMTTAMASDGHPKYHKQRQALASSQAAASPYPGISNPARMIEVRPGVWISSYGCITDDGQGRWFPCDMGGSAR